MADAGDLRQDYLPIAEHGLVGDLHTVALIGTTGTVDWYCCPAFDSPSVFGCILDAENGGYYGPGGRFELTGPTASARVPSRARDTSAAARLWSVAEDLTGVALPAPTPH